MDHYVVYLKHTILYINYISILKRKREKKAPPQTTHPSRPSSLGGPSLVLPPANLPDHSGLCCHVSPGHHPAGPVCPGVVLWKQACLCLDPVFRASVSSSPLGLPGPVLCILITSLYTLQLKCSSRPVLKTGLYQVLTQSEP